MVCSTNSLRRSWRRGCVYRRLFSLQSCGIPTGYLWLNFRYSFGGDLHPHQFYYPKLHFYIVGLVYGMSFAALKFFRAGWSWVGPSISLCGCSLTYWQDAIGGGLRALLLTDLCCTGGEEKHEVFDEHAPFFSGERPISVIG